jgi:phage terminase Nu1 subunit (DNA packaging protein)
MSSLPVLFVSVEDLASEAGVTVRTVQSWAKAGYFQKSGHNCYDLVGYYRWQNQCVNQQLVSLKEIASDWDSKWREGRARKAIAEAKLMELELQKLSASVIPRDVANFQLEKILSCCISSIKSLPSQVSLELEAVGYSKNMKQILKNGVTTILDEIYSRVRRLELPEELVEQCAQFYADYSSYSEDPRECS